MGRDSPRRRSVRSLRCGAGLREDESEMKLSVGDEELVISHSSSTSSSVVNLHDESSSFITNPARRQLCDSCTSHPAELWCEADQAFFCTSCDDAVHSANAFSSRHERVRVLLQKPRPEEAPPGANPKPSKRRRRKKREPALAEDPSAEESNGLMDEDEQQRQCSPDEIQIDLFLEDSENESAHAPVSEELDEQQGEDEEEEEEGELELPIVPPAPATCGNLNELLGWREFDSCPDPDKFHFAIKNNARLLPPVISGPDSFSALNGPDGEFHRRQLRQSEAQPQSQPQPSLHGRLLKLQLNREEIRDLWHRPMFLGNGDDDDDDDDDDVAKLVDSISDAGGSSDVGVVPDLNRARQRGRGAESNDQAGQVPVLSPAPEPEQVPGSAGREARVSRYREKRRTRLFSKKIRYEVRKLNAERRPRLKGRFVKRSSPAGSK